MRQLIIILSIIISVTNSYCQSNWTAQNPSIVPSTNPIYSSQDATVSADFKWNSPITFVDSSHLARLVVAYPNAFVVNTGTPSVQLNGVYVSNATFASLFGWTCHFGVGTTFAPNDILTFKITNVDVNDNTSYNNQPCTFSIDFISAPAETSLLDNVTVLFFNTIAEGVPMGIDTTIVDENVVFTNSISIYPNPTKNNVYIESELSEASTIKIEVLNLLGKTLMSEKFRNDKGVNVNYIYMDNFAKGTYLIRVSRNNIQVKSLILQKI